MTDQTGAEPSSAAGAAPAEEKVSPFQICISIGFVLGLLAGAIGSWIEFLSGGVPVLAIPMFTVIGGIGGAIAGAILGAVVHPLVMLLRR